MHGSSRLIAICFSALLTIAAPAFSQVQSRATGAAGSVATVRIAGTVRDETNAIALPGVPVEVAGTQRTVYTDVDGRYVIDVPPGDHELKVMLEGYQARSIKVATGSQKNIVADIALTMTRFAEAVTVTAQTVDVPTSSAEAQLIERKQAQVITDNVGSQDMRKNGDSDAASAMARVTGISLVDNQYVFVRGLGERYSNTTLAGSLIPTTEPDKKVVPLDLFPTGLIDSVQVSKSYSPDRSAEFAGGLVQIAPMKLPTQPMVDLSYGLNFFTTATGKDIPLSPLGNRDFWGFDAGARALSASFPSNKIVRSGIYTPDVGYSAAQITELGRLLGNEWRPVNESGKPGQNWSATFGNRFGNLGVVASATHSYREQFIAPTGNSS